jgi:serine/threonine protein kinase/tetratricopeptide (TPR) repeat protein
MRAEVEMSDPFITSRYRVIGQIGSGRLSQVYKVDDLLYERTLALKLLPNAEQADIERFKREFLLLKGLQHPNIIRVFDFGFTDTGLSYFTSEFIEGNNLKDYFKEIDYPKFYNVLIQISYTLDFLHSKKIIHGDIKPSNIIVSEIDDEPIIRLTDLGFAQSEKAIDLTQWKGTLAYLAPEIMRGEKYDHQADLYSFGVTLYEILTGRLPFEANTPMGLAKEHLEKEVAFTQNAQAIPEDLREITLNLLRKEPIDRVFSAREVINHLRNINSTEIEKHDKLQGLALVSSSSFVGRETELDILKKLYKESCSGYSKFALITGEFGVGKSSLIEEFGKYVQLQGGHVIKIKCNEQGDINPYDHLNHCLSLSLEKLNGNILDSLIDYTNELDFPLLLLIESLQFASNEVADFLSKLINKLNQVKMIVCAELREDFIDSDRSQKISDIKTRISSLEKKGFTEIALKNLSRAEVEKLLKSMFDWKGMQISVSELYRKSDGNPFMLKSFVASLVENQSLKREGNQWSLNLSALETIKGPEAFVRKIEKQFHHLDEQHKDILSAATVLGKEFKLEHLSEILPYDNSTIQKCTEDMTTLRLLEKKLDQDNKLSFGSQATRGLIYNKISESKKQELHLKVGELIQRAFISNLDPVVDELALHFYKAQDNELAFKYAILAGERALASFQNQTALEHYKHALNLYCDSFGKLIKPKYEILEVLGDVCNKMGKSHLSLDYYSKSLDLIEKESAGDAALARLYGKIAMIHQRSGNYDLSIGMLKKGIGLLDEKMHPRIVAEMLLELGWVYKLKLDNQNAISVIEKAINMLEEQNCYDKLAVAFNRLGVVYWSVGMLDEALQYYRKGIEICEQIDDMETLANLNNNVAILYRNKGEFNNAIHCLLTSLPYFEAISDTSRISATYNNLVSMYAESCQIDKAMEYCQKCLELKQKIGHTIGLATAYNNRGHILLRTGMFADSMKDFKKALQLYRSLDDLSGIALVCFNIADLYRQREEWKSALEYSTRSLRIRTKLSDKLGIAATLLLMGKILTQKGDFEAAKSNLLESLNFYNTQENALGKAEVHLALAELYLRNNDLVSVEEEISQCKTLPEAIQNNSFLGGLHRITGLIADVKNNEKENLKNLLESAKIFKVIDSKYELAQTYYEIGKIKLREEKLREARCYLKEALNIFKKLEVKSKEQSIQALMEQIKAASYPEKERFKVISIMTDLLNTLTNIDDLLQKILQLAIEFLGAERGAIIFYKPEDNSLEVKVMKELENETVNDALTISRKIVGGVLEEDKPLIVGDTRNHPEFSKSKSVKTYNILSIMCVPLRIKNKLIGTIYVDHRNLPEVFCEEDLKFLEVFSNLIASAIDNAQYYMRLSEEITSLKSELSTKYSYPDIVGKSAKMQEIFQIVERVAKSRTSILILGESGTGKEIIANLIHERSDRKDKPFIKVNCAALTETLLESELFGVEEKVATGVASRDGKFKQADGGTIFLDEIGDMSRSQSAILTQNG